MTTTGNWQSLDPDIAQYMDESSPGRPHNQPPSTVNDFTPILESLRINVVCDHGVILQWEPRAVRLIDYQSRIQTWYMIGLKNVTNKGAMRENKGIGWREIRRCSYLYTT